MQRQWQQAEAVTAAAVAEAFPDSNAAPSAAAVSAAAAAGAAATLLAKQLLLSCGLIYNNW